MKRIGLLEYWSIGVMGVPIKQHSNTPSLQMLLALREDISVSHRREQFTQSRTVRDISLLVGVLDEFLKHDLILRG